MTSYYSKEVNKIPLLTLEEERALATKAVSGNKMARDKLIAANLRFAIKWAYRYKNRGLEIEDLIQLANEGLIMAADKFDLKKKVRFCTYAVWWIRATINEALCNTNGIKLPKARLEEFYKGKWNVNSLDSEITNGEGENTTLLDFIKDDIGLTPDEAYYLDESLDDLKEMLDYLDSREKEIITLRFGLNGKKGLSLSAIGEKVGCSKERVRQLESKALRNLRMMFEEKDYDCTMFAA